MAEGGHVQDAAGVGETTADRLAAMALSRVAVEGGQAQQGGCLAVPEGAPFRQFCAGAGGSDGIAAGDRLNALGAACEDDVDGDAIHHALVARRRFQLARPEERQPSRRLHLE